MGAQVNGWYHRKLTAEGPPTGWRYRRPQNTEADWAQYHKDRHWYEKDDGCYIYRGRSFWNIRTLEGGHCYDCRMPADCPDCNSDGDWCQTCDGPSSTSLRAWRQVGDRPPEQGWALEGGAAPPPTLRVLYH